MKLTSFSKSITLAIIASVFAGCAYHSDAPYSPPKRTPVPQKPISEAVAVPIDVTVKRDSSEPGGFSFRYFGPYTNSNGDIDLTGNTPPFRKTADEKTNSDVTPPTLGEFADRQRADEVRALSLLDIREEIVKLQFRLVVEESVAGIRFLDQREAMYIDLARNLKPNESPTKPYEGRVFLDFNTSRNAEMFEVIDLNNDGQVYRYSLRFKLGSDFVVDDPETDNGDHPH